MLVIILPLNSVPRCRRPNAPTGLMKSAFAMPLPVSSMMWISTCPGFAAEMMFSQIKTLGRTTRRLNLYLNGTGIKKYNGLARWTPQWLQIKSSLLFVGKFNILLLSLKMSTCLDGSIQNVRRSNCWLFNSRVCTVLSWHHGADRNWG